ncbi:unnamed protein product [Closterium sp. NIES-54]
MAGLINFARGAVVTPDDPDLRAEFCAVQLLTFMVISRCCSPGVQIALKWCQEYLDAGHQAWHFIESTYQVTDDLFIAQLEGQLTHMRMGNEETATDYCNQTWRILATIRMAGVQYSTASYVTHVMQGLSSNYNLVKRLSMAPGTRTTLNEDNLTSYILQDEAMQEAERSQELMAQANFVAPTKQGGQPGQRGQSRGGGSSRRRECWLCGDPDHLSFEYPDRSDSDDDDTKGGRERSGSRRPRRGRNQPCKEKQSTKTSTSAKDADSSAGGKVRDDKTASCSLVGVVEPTVSFAPEAGEDFQAVAAAAQANPVVVLLDSDCSHHLMGTKEVFVDLQPRGSIKHVRGFNGALQDVQGRGTVALQGEAGKRVLIPDVLYVPGVRANLLSSGQLKEHGVKLQKDGDGMLLVSAAAEVLGRATYSGRVLCTDLRPCPARSTSPAPEVVALRAIVSKTKSTPDQMHARLAHVDMDTIRSSAKNEVSIGLDLESATCADSPCVSCVGGKLARHTFPDQGSDANDVLAVVHIDLCGPFRVAAKDGSLNFYAAHQLNLHPRVSLPETSSTLRWTGKVGDASAFRVWGSRAFVRDLSADKLSTRAVPCVFLGFPPDAPGWQFYHPTSRRVLSSQDVTFDKSVPYYRLFPYRTAPLPPLPLFLAPGPPPVDPLPPQGPAPSGVSQVDTVEPVEVVVDSGAARSAEPAGAGSGGAEPEGAEPGGAESKGADPWGAEPGGAESGGAEPGGAESGGAESGGAEPGGAEPGGAGSARVASHGTLSRRELLSPQELREWFARRWSRAAGAGGTTVAAGPGGTRTGGAGAAGTGGAAGAAGVGPAGGAAGAAGGTRVGPAGAGAAGATGAGAAGGVGAGCSAGAGASEGAGVDAVGARGATGTGAAAGGTGAVPAGSRGATRPRPYFVPPLEQVLGLPPSTDPAPPLACTQPVQSRSQLQPASPLLVPSPYTGPTGGLAERREPTSRPASLVRAARTSRRAPRLRPPAVPGTHQMALRPSSAPLRVPLPSTPDSSLLVPPDPESDSLRAASPTVMRLLSTAVTDPSFESSAASALVAELNDFAARYRLDYATSLVAASESVCPPSIGGECALSTDVLEDRQEEFQCFAAALPHLVSTLLAPEGDPDAPDIPTPRSYAEVGVSLPKSTSATPPIPSQKGSKASKCPR